jgi:hypothetical protein
VIRETEVTEGAETEVTEGAETEVTEATGQRSTRRHGDTGRVPVAPRFARTIKP